MNFFTNTLTCPPNPRLQRTPPASPPSPLSRKPFGGRALPVNVVEVRLAIPVKLERRL